MYFVKAYFSYFYFVILCTVFITCFSRPIKNQLTLFQWSFPVHSIFISSYCFLDSGQLSFLINCFSYRFASSFSLIQVFISCEDVYKIIINRQDTNGFDSDVVCVVYVVLRDLVPFVQSKKVEDIHGRVLLLVRLQVSDCKFTKSNTRPWVFFTFFNLYKWCQIAQVSYACF